jgi:hypothetical protein
MSTNERADHPYELASFSKRIDDIANEYGTELQVEQDIKAALHKVAAKLTNIIKSINSAAPKEPAPIDTDDDEHVRMCASKKRYRTADVALTVAAARPLPLRVYPCRCCHGFHLTKNTDPLQTSRHTP